jgi:hypothetical protein
MGNLAFALIEEKKYPEEESSFGKLRAFVGSAFSLCTASL